MLFTSELKIMIKVLTQTCIGYNWKPILKTDQVLNVIPFFLAVEGSSGKGSGKGLDGGGRWIRQQQKSF